MADLDELERRINRLEALAADPAWLLQRDVLSRSVRGLAPSGVLHTTDGGPAILTSGGDSIFAQNAYIDNDGLWKRWDTTKPAQIIQMSSPAAIWIRFAAAGVNPISWTSTAVIGEPGTDANGWRYTYQWDGKRRWRKRWLALAMPAAAAADIISGQALPQGIVTVGGADWFLSWSSAGNAFDINLGIDRSDAATSLAVAAGSTDGTNLNVRHATINLFVEAVER